MHKSFKTHVSIVCLIAQWVLCASCRDASAERFARAKLRYEELIYAGKHPNDPAFDALLQDFDAVRADSRHKIDADKLASAIRNVRTRVRAPLALGALSTTRSDALKAQLAICAAMAAGAGRDGGVDLEAKRAIDTCRKTAEQLELRDAHSESPEDEAHLKSVGGDGLR